jgi:hypothetical protein
MYTHQKLMRKPTLVTTMPDKNNRYLDYLDKEMTIMGILSTFSIAVVAVVLDRVGSAEPSKGSFFSVLWNGPEQRVGAVTDAASLTVPHMAGASQAPSILIGSLWVALAALLFYVQRSTLAWFYGQISLSIERRLVDRQDTDDWYRDADSWSTWIFYQLAFTSLIIGFAFYGYAVVAARWVFNAPILSLLWSLTLATIVVQVFRVVIFRRYKYHDDPQGSLVKWWLCKRLRPKGLRRVVRNRYRRKP